MHTTLLSVSHHGPPYMLAILSLILDFLNPTTMKKEMSVLHELYNLGILLYNMKWTRKMSPKIQKSPFQMKLSVTINLYLSSFLHFFFHWAMQKYFTVGKSMLEEMNRQCIMYIRLVSNGMSLV